MTPIPDWTADLAAAIAAQGTAAFQSRLRAFLNQIVPVDHCVAFTYARDGAAPGHLFTDTAMDAAQAERLARAYVERFHAQDPNSAAIEEADGSTQRFQGPYDEEYRRTFFDRTGLVDKAATVGQVDGARVYCNFYRMAHSGPYSADDWLRLEQILPVATGLIAAHYRLVRMSDGPAMDSVSLVHSLIGQGAPPFDQLTARERDVCERILLGLTTLGIGLDLDIAPSSVITYRKRAYAKLGIASQNELFRLCLDKVRPPL